MIVLLETKPFGVTVAGQKHMHRVNNLSKRFIWLVCFGFLLGLLACNSGPSGVFDPVKETPASPAAAGASLDPGPSSPTFTPLAPSPWPTETPTVLPSLTPRPTASLTPSPSPTFLPSPTPVPPPATLTPLPVLPTPTQIAEIEPEVTAEIYRYFPVEPAQPDLSQPCPGCPRAPGYIAGHIFDAEGRPLAGVRLVCYNSWHRYPVVGSKGGGAYDFPIIQAEATWYVEVLDEADRPLSPAVPVPFNPQEACWYRLDWQRID